MDVETCHIWHTEKRQKKGRKVEKGGGSERRSFFFLPFFCVPNVSTKGGKERWIPEQIDQLQQQKGRPLKIYGGTATTGKPHVGY